MTKTEIKLILRPTHYLSKKDRQNIVDYIEEKEQRIEKAIDFMNKWGMQPDWDMSVEMREYTEFQELLNILKGEEK